MAEWAFTLIACPALGRGGQLLYLRCKVTKHQAGKILPRSRPDSLARVFRQAFALFFLQNVCLNNELSADKLRAKSDKTMVALCGWQGHSKFLLKRRLV